MVRRGGRGVERADSIRQNQDALSAKTPQDRTARALPEKGRGHTSFTSKCIAECAGELLDDFSAIDRGDVTDHFVGVPLRADAGHNDRIKCLGGVLSEGKGADAQH